jgi:hypothetical protein
VVANEHAISNRSVHQLPRKTVGGHILSSARDDEATVACGGSRRPQPAVITSSEGDLLPKPILDRACAKDPIAMQGTESGSLSILQPPKAHKWLAAIFAGKLEGHSGLLHRLACRGRSHQLRPRIVPKTPQPREYFEYEFEPMSTH